MFGGPTKRQPEPVCVLDIGSNKVVCLIGREELGLGVRLIGSGFGVSAGLKGGAVIDLDAAEVGIRTAVEKAERAAGITVQDVCVNVALRSLRSKHMTVQTQFASGAVADRDLKRVLNSSMSELDQADEAILHAIPLNWQVDDEDGIRDPRGMYGQRLGVDMHFVMGGIGPLRNLAHCIERCHLTIRSVTVSPYAAALSVLTEDERDLGVTLIDLGGGITSAAIFRDNTLVHVDALGVGGRNITSDLARGLSTPFEAAERIKMIYGSCLHGADDATSQVPCPPIAAQDELHYEPRALVTNIIRSRVEETLELLRERIHKAGLESYSGRQVVLTGGGAHLNGVRELATHVLGKRVRIGHPHGVFGLSEQLSQPDFAVATGLLKSVFDDRPEVVSGPPDLSGRRLRAQRYTGNAFGRSMQWLRENF